MVRRDPQSTRQELLEAAFEEMYVHGFQATGLDQILVRTGVTKGALYHHFKNKQELGYAVFDEIIRPGMLSRWEEPLAGSDDPVQTLKDMMYAALEENREHLLERGCPLNNLTQEMSQVDAGFHARIQKLLGDWRRGVTEALERGKAAGNIRPDVDTDATAAFVIASWEGMAGMAKGTGDLELVMGMGRVLESFLDGLRPAHVPAGA